MTMSAYRTPGRITPTLTPEEERKFLRALRHKPWIGCVGFTLLMLAFVVEATLTIRR